MPRKVRSRDFWSSVFEGSAVTNAKDASRKGRLKETFTSARTLGERNVKSRLTPEQVSQIRTRSSERWQKLAKEFAVTDVTIGHIVRRQTWKHLP